MPREPECLGPLLSTGAEPGLWCRTQSGGDCIYPLPPQTIKMGTDCSLQGSHPTTHPLRHTQKPGLRVCRRGGPSLQMRFYPNCHMENQADRGTDTSMSVLSGVRPPFQLLQMKPMGSVLLQTQGTGHRFL